MSRFCLIPSRGLGFCCGLSRVDASTAHLVALVVLGIAHLYATFTLLPPDFLLSRESILGADHPAHAYRVDIYRRSLASGTLPWGWDPRIGAGTVMVPAQDAGAKPQQVAGVLLPFLEPGSVIKYFLFAVVLATPLIHYRSMKLLGFTTDERLWGLVLLLCPLWLYSNFRGFLQWGLAAYALASILAPWTLAQFLKFCQAPARGTYAFATASLSLLFFLHVLGPVVIAPALVVIVLGPWTLSRNWRLAAMGAPVIACAANFFWLVPFLYNLSSNASGDGKLSVYPSDLTYVSFDHLLTMLSPRRLMAAAVALLGAAIGFFVMYHRLGSRPTAAFATAVAVGLLLKFGGSFAPVIVEMQPSRFLLPAFILLTLPTALAAASITNLLRVPHAFAVSGVCIAMIAAAACLPESSGKGRKHVNYAGYEENERPTFLNLPGSVPLPRLLDELTAFVNSNTEAGHRLLVQTRLQAEQRLLALEWDREVIGNTYPDIHDPTNFRRNSLWGRAFADWQPDELRDGLSRWGINWAFTCTDEATALFQQALRRPGISVGVYTAFRISDETTPFLTGSGEAQVAVNTIRLSNVTRSGEKVVLRYRYHPAWSAEDGSKVSAFPVPEDPAGFLVVEPLGPSCSLRFSPLKALQH